MFFPSVIEDGLGSNVALLLSQLGTIGSGLVIALIYSWKLTLIATLSIFLSAVAIVIGGKVLLKLNYNYQYLIN